MRRVGGWVRALVCVCDQIRGKEGRGWQEERGMGKAARDITYMKRRECVCVDSEVTGWERVDSGDAT